MSNKLKYKLANLVTLDELKNGKFIYSAEYTLPVKLDDDKVAIAQFDLIEENYKQKLENKVYDLVSVNNQLQAVETKIQKIDYMETNSLGVYIKKQLDLFFNNLNVFKDLGIINVKRGALLHSQPGQGKSAAIAKMAREYAQEKNACVLIWATGYHGAGQRGRTLLTRTADLSKADKLLLVAEDLGGGNTDEGVHHNSVDASLLNFLDGVSVNFPVPTFILATTNQPDAHLPSLTSRPGRFDIVQKVPDLE